jgi:hypothetical protein
MRQDGKYEESQNLGGDKMTWKFVAFEVLIWISEMIKVAEQFRISGWQG